MRFFQRFLCTIAVVAVTSANPDLVQGQDFVSCQIYAATESPQGARPAAHHAPLRADPQIAALLERVVAVYRKRGHSLAPTLALTTSDVANAFIRPDETIVVTTSLLRLVGTNAQLSFVIAHELAHMALGHPHDATQEMEQHADTLAIKILNDLELEPCSAIEVLNLMSLSHPVYTTPLQRRISHVQTLLGAQCLNYPPIVLSAERIPLLR
jgi:Zn-dependent protease with chaperone function